VGKVRIGIVGVGNVAPLHVPGYFDNESCEVTAVCDSNLARARAFANEWNVPHVFGTLGELLGSDLADAVEILTPTHLHAQHVIDSARAGKHVSCQKPIATTVDDARRMTECCESAKVHFRVAENACFYAPLVEAKRLIANGAIGTPTVVRIKTVVGATDSAFQSTLDPAGYLWRLDAHSPGGHLFDDVIHKYAMATWLVDEEVAAVQAVVRNGRLLFEAPTVALLEYARPDLLGIIEVEHAPGMFIDSDWYGADEFFEIQGTEGFVWVTRLSGQLLELPPLVVRSGRTTTHMRDIDARYETSFRRSASAFIHGILEGEPVDLIPSSAIKSLQLAFAIYRSSNERGRVDPAEINGTVSPPWWPKAPEELLNDAIVLGFLPEAEPPPELVTRLGREDDEL
jgi:predicted dehydrogenase